MLSRKAWEYIHAKPKRFNLLHGAVRSSKTTNCLIVMPKRFKKAPTNGAIVITGKTERTAYRNIIKPLQQMYGTKRVKYSVGSAEGSIGGRDFYVIGANDEKAVTKIQGMTISWWFPDEAATYPQSFIDMAVTRMSPEGAGSDWTMNPAGPYHPIKTNFIDKALEPDLRNEIAEWHFTLEDNLNLTESYKKTLYALYPKGSLFYKRYILGLWVYAEGAIYDFFDEDVHRLKAIPDRPFDYYTLSGDYGIGNATSIGLYGHFVNPWQKIKCVRLKGYYYSGSETGKQKTDLDYADDVKAEFGDFKNIHKDFKIDPSASSFKVTLERKGWRVVNAENDVLDGIRTQSAMLKSSEYVIGPDASNDQCVKDYSAYLWDPKAQAKGEDKPLKINDHCLIAGTMVLTRHGEKPIESINVGEEVLTRAGYKRVFDSGLTNPEARVYKARFSDGTVLTGTGNHPVFVQGRGYIRMDELRYADVIIKACLTPKKSSMATRFIGAIQTQKTRAISAISNQAARVNTCIGKFGSTITARYHQIMKYIMQIATLQTTQLTTSSYYQNPSTKGYTVYSEHSKVNTKKKCLKVLPSGTGRTLVGRGIVNRLELHGLGVRLLKENANSAKKVTQLYPDAKLTVSAQMPASQPSEEHQARMTKLEYAKHVNLSLKPTNTVKLKTAHVLAVERLEEKSAVFNLSVEDLPEFFANGVLTHNTKDEERYELYTEYRNSIVEPRMRSLS